MKKGLSPVFVVLLIAVSLPYLAWSNSVLTDYSFFDERYEDNGTSNGSSIENISLSCVFELEPCSISIIGNIQLILFYGIILGVSAKIISDGAEMLLDLGLPPTIIGGIVLPLLGAVPDSAMIIASGSSGDPKVADQQIAVGMGTLAGSTIMLLTIPWVGAMILGRVDIVDKSGIDGQVSKFKPSSFWKSGISVSSDVTYSAIVMIITAIPYLIVQGADWYYGASRVQDFGKNKPPLYIKYTAITTFVICMISFIGYLAYLLIFSAASRRRDEIRRQQRIQRKVLKKMILSLRGPTRTIQADADSKDQETGGEKKPLISRSETGLQKKYFSAWRVHKKQTEPSIEEAKDDGDTHSHDSEEENEVEEPKWKIAIKSLAYLTVGVGLVTIFSDPMVDALSRLVDPDNANYENNGSRGQYIPIPVFYLSFVVTPLCSNASELVSSLIFASKKKKVNSSMTFSQLYGAATMNNTLCLGIFAALVGFRGLTWQYSAEVTVILLVQVIMGIIALSFGFLYNHTYVLLLIFPVFILYFGAILVTWMLENFLHWK